MMFCRYLIEFRYFIAIFAEKTETYIFIINNSG